MKKERLESLFDLLKNDGNDSFLNFAIAQEYLKLDNKKEALRYFEKLIDGDPDYIGTYYHLAKLYSETGQRNLPIETCQTGIKITGQQEDKHSQEELKNLLSLIMDEDYG